MKSKYDHITETVTFLYKLAEGKVEKSFGINIAKTVG
jgi:DNA mismatch repair ATPase MutS